MKKALPIKLKVISLYAVQPQICKFDRVRLKMFLEISILILSVLAAAGIRITLVLRGVKVVLCYNHRTDMKGDSNVIKR